MSHHDEHAGTGERRSAGATGSEDSRGGSRTGVLHKRPTFEEVVAGVQVDQTVRTQEVVATFDVYGEAERAVDLLADRDFPVERTAIIGRGLHMVEKVTARLTWASAAGRGALAGAVPGALVGWIFGLFNWVNPLAAAVLLALYGAIFGAVIGALTGVLIYALSRGRRDFVSVTALGADHYDLVVDADVTEQAVRLLEEAGLRRASPAPDGQA